MCQAARIPRKYVPSVCQARGPHSNSAEPAAVQAPAPLRERFPVKPGEDAGLDQHGEEAKGNDHVLAVDPERFVGAAEEDEVPDEPEREGRDEIGEAGV
jgi:hypothetical protein